MSYKDTVDWMFSQLPMYQKIGDKAYKKDLGNILKLAEHLSNPHKDFKSIHVAGTNGKGSTSHMLSSVLQESGYKVGLYTSPHLKDFRERIKIDGQNVDKTFVVDFIESNKDFFIKNSLSFFEMTVGMAFSYFSKEKVDIAIIEVGLGGRLDSTNIIMPELSVITNIGYDHTAILGNTLDEIAVEKAGIIKENVPIVIGETQLQIKSLFERIANERNSSITFADQEITATVESDLKGAYQAKNLKTVLQSLAILIDRDYKISETDIKNGLENVMRNTGLLGRWQIIQENPKIICDTAHNTEGLRYVINQLLDEDFNSLRIVFGVVREKNLDTIIALMPKDAIYYFCSPDIERGLNVEYLQEKFQIAGYAGKAFSSVGNALSAAKNDAEIGDLIFVGGSTFVVAEVL